MPADACDAPNSGTSVFDPVLCELLYRWFCPPRGLVFDPFAGGSVRGVVAGMLGRGYVGIDLREEQIAANRRQWEEISVGEECSFSQGEKVAPSWVLGDSRDAMSLCPGVEADFVFSCPPYADLERYSDDPADLSTLAYPEFKEPYASIIASSIAILKPNRFACFVVGEVRGKDGAYYGFVPDTIRAFEAAGAKFYNEAILVTAIGSLPIRVGRQFVKGRKLGKTHQNVLVFIKGNPQKAVEDIGVVDFGDVEEAGGLENES